MKKLPPWALVPDDGWREVSRLRAMTDSQRWREFREVQHLMELVLAANPERERVLASRDEPSPESRALWERLMRRHRGRPQ